MKRNYALLNNFPLNPQKVKIRLIEKGLRVSDLANKLELKQPLISRYVNGKGRNPKIQEAIAAILGLSLERILQKPEQSTE